MTAGIIVLIIIIAISSSISISSISIDSPAGRGRITRIDIVDGDLSACRPSDISLCALFMSQSDMAQLEGAVVAAGVLRLANKLICCQTYGLLGVLQLSDS